VAGSVDTHAWRPLESARWRVAWHGRVPIIIVAGLGLAAIVALVLITVDIAFRTQEGLYTLNNFRVLYSEPFAYKSLLNTLGFATVAVLTALFFGVPMAWLAERTDLAGRGAIYPLMTVGILVPGFFTAMGWLFLFHPRIGVVNVWLTEILSIDRSRSLAA
jgi:iron(III) transport system permease protein